MKKMKWKGWIVLAAIMTGVGCQKQDTTLNPQAGSRFDAGAAKEWYYGVFKKSDGWQSSPEKGKKLPDWSHPFITNMGSSAVVEFPLTEAGVSYSIASSGREGKLSPEQLKRIAAASITRIAFIRQSSGNVLVREFEYIPDWDYLLARRFDISNTSIFNASSNFSGRLIVKEWGGKIVSMAMLENGKTVKRGKRNTGEQNGITMKREQCFEQEFCVWQMDCTLNIYPDGMITQDCTDWYNTGECWMEYWCEEGGDPCELAGIGCGGDEDPDPDVCTNSQAIFDDIVSSGTPLSQNEEILLTSNGPLTRTKTYKWKFFEIGSVFTTLTFSSKETGTHIWNLGAWRWQSLVHNNIIKNGTSILWSAECENVDPEPLLLGNFAKMRLEYTIKVSYNCGVINLESNNSYTTDSPEWYPND